MENSNQATTYPVKFINPEEIVKKLGFGLGLRVADFGCGTGYFTYPIARAIGSEGLIYALDILKEKVENIESQAKLLGLTNIAARRVNLEKIGGSGLKENSLDWVLLVNMLFQNKNKGIILEEAKRVLKSGGHILIIEWDPLNVSLGPERSVRIKKEEIIQLADQYNLGITEELAISDFHYGLILSKLK